MSRISILRVIVDSKPSPANWNMAVDQSLLNSAITSNAATLRWYRWSQPTISLGYFQKRSDLDADVALSGLPCVRRITGGGAILHDNELTYSVSLPASQRLFQHPEELYDIIHRGLIAGLASLEIAVDCRGQTTNRADEPFLCFLRQDSHDLVVNGRKVLGSAQRRRRGAILQHGSLILSRSNWAPSIPGLADLTEQEMPQNLVETLSNYVAREVADCW